MGKGFAFVDCTAGDNRAIRRLALSHVMKGKNTGKERRRRRARLDPGRVRQVVEVAPSRGTRSPTAGSRDRGSLQNSPDQPCTAIGGEISSVPLPVGVTPDGHTIARQFFATVVDALCPSELCHSLDQVLSCWMQILFMDSFGTSYHCSIAFMAILNGFCFDSELVSPQATYHLTKAISLVNQSLETPGALSNSNLAVVNFLIVLEMVREEQPKAQVHMNGLHRMVELRGGLSQLGEDHPLGLKLCKTDLDYALHYGTSTHFFRDQIHSVEMALASRGFPIARENFDSQPRFYSMDPILQQVMLDAGGIATLFNKNAIRLKIDPSTLQEVVVSLGGRLVRFHPLGGPDLENRIEQVCHTGLAAFAASLFLQFRGRRFFKYGMVAQCLRRACDAGIAQEDNDLILWLLFVGGISVVAGSDEPWLHGRIKTVAHSLGIKSWQDAHRCLVQFPWITSLHGDAGKLLWNSAMATPA